MADLLAKLPLVPPSLKSIAPYLQRAEELRTQDPIIAYWCAYYAAQIGINLKTRDAASRDLLLALLGALEQTKNDIGPDDAIHNESASSAYVENFGLKVFANADNEDRNAHTTRSTAKKFLAAANFLEVLKTFPKSDISESNEEKIRYAKWKAADIAKAFREGRKPAPGPPGWAEEQEELRRLQQQELEQQQIPSAPTLPLSDSEFHLVSESTIAAPTLSSYEAPQDEPSSPASNINFSHAPASSQPPNDLSRPHLEWVESGDYASESWTTMASGIPDPPSLNSANLGWGEISSSNWPDKATDSNIGEERGDNAPSGSSSSSDTIASSGDQRPLERASQEVEVQYSPVSSVGVLAEPDNQLYFSPSTLSPQPPQPPSQPHFGTSAEYRGSLSMHTSPQSPVFSSSHEAFVQQSPSVVYSRSRAPPPPAVPVPVREDPVELTPDIIAKAQKHCRFAVSALNYDDVEQAKKELRAALALLGG